MLESEWGELLDITWGLRGDPDPGVLLGMAVHAWPELGATFAWILGGSFAIGSFASFAVVSASRA